MSQTPTSGASAIVCRDDRVLLIKRGKDPYKGCWSLPGGSQHFGETLEECAVRELEEETGLVAGDPIFAAVRDRIAHNVEGNITHHYVLATFVVTSVSGKEIAGDDATEVGWYSLSEMNLLDTTPETPAFVAEVLRDMVES